MMSYHPYLWLSLIAIFIALPLIASWLDKRKYQAASSPSAMVNDDDELGSAFDEESEMVSLDEHAMEDNDFGNAGVEEIGEFDEGFN